MADSPDAITVQVLKSMLEANASYQALTLLTTGEYKTFWGMAAQDVEMPYVLIKNMSPRGQGTTKRPESDLEMRVVAYAKSASVAYQLKKIIHEVLHNKPPVVPVDVCASPIGVIWGFDSIYDPYILQNVYYCRAGGDYRVRLGLEY